MRVVLISCSAHKISLKEGEKIEAAKLYDSALFTKSLEYAHSLQPNRTFIISAKHHLLELTDEIEWYENKLSNKVKERKEWSAKVLDQLKEKGCDLANDEFVILAGELYSKYLLEGDVRIVNGKLPLKGLKIGDRLHTLGELINK